MMMTTTTTMTRRYDLGIDWLYMFEKYLFLSISINFSNYLRTHLSPSISLSNYLAISIYAYLSTFLVDLCIHLSIYSRIIFIDLPNYWQLKPAVLMKLRWGNSFQRCWRMAPRQLSRRPALHDTDAKILGDRPSIHQYLQSVMNIPDPRFSTHQHSPTIHNHTNNNWNWLENSTSSSLKQKPRLR